MGLQKAIPAKLTSSTQPKERNTTFKIGDKIYDVTKCRCKTFYSLLIETKAIPSNGFQKVKTDFNLEDDDVKEVFRLSKTAATETFINSFQYKILNDIIYTNSRLAKIGYVQSNSCTLCGMCRETRNHLFFLCSFSEKFWNEFANYWLLVSGTHFTPTLQNVIVGKFDFDSDFREQKLLNYLLLLGKLHLWNSRKSNTKPKMSSFTDLVKQKYKTEQYKAKKNNYEKEFEKKWDLIAKLY